MRHRQAGFTLIELMIVVAIIGILASVAVPMYMQFVAKSKWKSAYSELSTGRISIDVMRNQGDTPTLAQINVATATVHCNNSLSFDGQGVATYECVINGGPAVMANGVITLTRDIEGAWNCKTTIPQKIVGEASQCVGTGS